MRKLAATRILRNYYLAVSYKYAFLCSDESENSRLALQAVSRVESVNERRRPFVLVPLALLSVSEQVVASTEQFQPAFLVVRICLIRS